MEISKDYTCKCLEGENFQGQDLSGVDFSGSNCMRANFRSANLSGANLSLVYLDWADLTGANLTGVIPNWNSHDLIAEMLRQGGWIEEAHYVWHNRHKCWAYFNWIFETSEDIITYLEQWGKTPLSGRYTHETPE